MPDARQLFLQAITVLLFSTMTRVHWWGGKREAESPGGKPCSRTFTNILSVYLSTSHNNSSATGLKKESSVPEGYELPGLHSWVRHLLKLRLPKNWGLPSNPSDQLRNELRGSLCTTRSPVLTEQSAGFCRCYTITGPSWETVKWKPTPFWKFQIFFHGNTITYRWFAVLKSIREYYVQSTGG